VGIGLKIPAGGGYKFLCFGSGACVDESGLVVTAKHVIAYYYSEFKNEELGVSGKSVPEFEVIFTFRSEDGWRMAYARPDMIWLKDNCDIAILRIPARKQGWPSFSFPTKERAFIEEGESVATYGYPLRRLDNLSAFPNLLAGIVSHVEMHPDSNPSQWRLDEIIVDLSAHTGNSGGPVFRSDSGELIGVISSHQVSPTRVEEQPTDVSEDHAIRDSTKLVNVWTNLTKCVPFTCFASTVEDLLAGQHGS
jgi:S1-C subfamily serine protease